MKRFEIIDLKTSKVVGHYTADTNQQANYGGPWRNPKKFEHKEVADKVPSVKPYLPQDIIDKLISKEIVTAADFPIK